MNPSPSDASTAADPTAADNPSTAADPRALAVPEGLEGERLDAAMARLFGFSRTRAVELISQGRVRLDGSSPAKSERVAAGAWLEVDLPALAVAGPAIVSTPVANLLIVHDDDDIVVVDKPVGVAAHPSPGWDGPTVVGALVAAGYRVSTSGAEERQGVVHRLDVGTSGLMAVAKSEYAYTVLKQAFRDRTVDKTYHALVQGHPDPARGTIDAPIDRHPVHDYKFAVVADGKPSVTHYETLEAHAMASLLEIKLETGRTHQIRVHMAALRHPCVGDLAYGADPTLATKVGLTRQWLHAARLAFAHPRTGRWVEFASAYPADLEHALTVVRAGLEGERRAHS
ncbi:MAG TPA: RluA family pseudouridine synthase [Acidothermaceae bacterium]